MGVGSICARRGIGGVGGVECVDVCSKKGVCSSFEGKCSNSVPMHGAHAPIHLQLFLCPHSEQSEV